MSYRGVGSYLQPLYGFGAGAAQQCVGGEVSEDGLGGRGDHCCPSSSWSNYDYKKVKGATSFRYWNEKRVRHVIKQLLVPTAGFANAAEAQAYDEELQESGGSQDIWGTKVTVKPGFISRLSNAFNNYLSLFPGTRWWSEKNAKKGKYDDGECGPYSAWRSKPVAVTQHVGDILRTISGSKITNAKLKSIKEWDYPWDPRPKEPTFPGGQSQKSPWDGVPMDFYYWAAKAHNAIKGVPGGERKQNVNIKTMPSYPQIIQRNGNVIGPTPWLTEFMDAFSRPRAVISLVAGSGKKGLTWLHGGPIKAAMQPIGPLVSLAKGKSFMTAVQDSSIRPMVDEERGTPQPADANGGINPLLIVGGLALVGVGAYFVLKR